MLVMMAGLPGTGKTTLAYRLRETTGAVVLSKDTVRHALFPPELVEYSTEQDDFVVEVLLRTAAWIWKGDAERMVIVDGRTFSTVAQRQYVISFAERMGQPWKIVECVCGDETAKRRLSAGDAAHPAENRTPNLYEEVKRRWEPIEKPHLVVNTEEPVEIEELRRKIEE